MKPNINTKEAIIANIKARKEQAKQKALADGIALHALLLEDNPMPQSVWNEACKSLESTGAFTYEGKPVQKPVVKDECLVMEDEGYGISEDQLKQFQDSTNKRAEKLEKNQDKSRKGVQGFVRAKDLEIKSLEFNSGVAGGKSRLKFDATATVTKLTRENLTL